MSERVADPPATGGQPLGLEHGLWHRLGDRFGLVALRPRLASDVDERRVGDEFRLSRGAGGVDLALSEQEARLVRQFDGRRTISELVVAELGHAGTLEIEPILRLIDRVMRAEMLADFPPNMFRQLDGHLARRAVDLVERRRGRGGDALPDSAIEAVTPVSQFEQVPWRPRTPLLAERVQFLRSVELLRAIDLPTLGTLAEALHEEAFPAASSIVSEGQESDRFFIIKSGDANVLKRIDGELKRIARLGAGDYFGESGLLDNTARNATVRSGPSRPLVAYTVEAETFERIISPHVAAFRGRQLVSKRRARLQEVKLFSTLSAEDIERLAQVIREHRVPEGTTIFEQGEIGDRLYVVIDGSVRVVRDGVPVADFGPGDFFGETALLFTSHRTATVVASTDATLWSLDKPAFEQLMRGHLLSRRDMMPTLLNRIRG